jgi:hypothetical protein
MRQIRSVTFVTDESVVGGKFSGYVRCRPIVSCDSVRRSARTCPSDRRATFRSRRWASYCAKRGGAAWFAREYGCDSGCHPELVFTVAGESTRLSNSINGRDNVEVLGYA